MWQNYRLKKDWTSDSGVELKKGAVVTQREKDFDPEDREVLCLAPGQIEVRIPRSVLEQVRG